VSLLVWNLTLDLSGLGDPTSSYATAGIALEIIGTRKLHRHKAETPPGGFVDTTINKFGKKNYPSTQSKEACTVVISNVKGISDKFKRIGNKYNIKNIFKTKHTLRNVFVRNKPDTNFNNR
jgi:hypothetical protein